MHPRYPFRGGHSSMSQISKYQSNATATNPKQKAFSYQNAHSTSKFNSNKSDLKILYILRGLPGSGKSTLARKLSGKTGVILSTDDYFVTPSGYFFDGSLVPAAHDWNQKRASDCMAGGLSPIIIDNTNTTSWEMKPYMMMAIDNRYQIKILEPDTWWKFKENELEKRNIHNVPKESIAAMLSRYEKNVTVNSVLGRQLFFQYQNQCLGYFRGNNTKHYCKNANTSFVRLHSDLGNQHDRRPDGWWNSSQVLVRPQSSSQPDEDLQQDSPVTGINDAMKKMSIGNNRRSPPPRRDGWFYQRNRSYQQHPHGSVKPGFE